MAFITTLLNALIAIPKIADYVQQLVNAIIIWQVNRANNQTLQAISDAAALSAQAKTAQDRFAAAQAWQEALARPKVSAQ